MWKWIISPTGRTIVIYTAIVIASLLIARWYGNQQWAKGEAEGRQYVADKLTKEKEWAERERQLMDAAAKLQEQASAINKAAAELAATRASMQASLDTNFALSLLRLLLPSGLSLRHTAEDVHFNPKNTLLYPPAIEKHIQFLLSA